MGSEIKLREFCGHCGRITDSFAMTLMSGTKYICTVCHRNVGLELDDEQPLQPAAPPESGKRITTEGARAIAYEVLARAELEREVSRLSFVAQDWGNKIDEWIERTGCSHPEVAAARIRELEAIAERMESAIQTADGSHCSYCREYLHPQLAAPLAEYTAYRQKHGGK